MNASPITFDTNLAVYALTEDSKAPQARLAIEAAHFISVQLLNELANVGRKKLGLSWPDVAVLTDKMREAVSIVLPVDDGHHREALRIAARYQLSFYDALMLAVALSGGARTFYSEDMQHDLLIDGTLRIVDPYRPDTRL